MIVIGGQSMILTTLRADELPYSILRDLMSQVGKLESSSAANSNARLKEAKRMMKLIPARHRRNLTPTSFRTYRQVFLDENAKS